MSPDRTPQYPPVIKPLAGGLDRPLWSVMIPSYNCGNYLEETIKSVLLQAPDEPQMQIAVIDDCSTDIDVEALVKDIGKGRLDFFRQPENAGSLRNFETCINMASGHLVHILHGDDQVMPGFYAEIENLFNEHPSIGAAFTGLSLMDKNGTVLFHNDNIQNNAGIIDNWIIKVSSNQLLQACGIVVKRSVYEELGGFCGVHYGEDWEMWVRIASKFPVAYSPKNLALYRRHDNNISTRLLSTGQNIKDIETVIETIQNYIPADKRKAIKKIAQKNFAIYFAGNAQNIYKTGGNARVAIKQAHGALRMHVNKRTVTSLLKLYIKVLVNYRGKYPRAN